MQDPMPTTYESKTTSSSATGPGLQMDYIRTVPGILKITEMLLATLVYICTVSRSDFPSSNWIQFVALSSFFTLFSLVAMHAFAALPREMHRAAPFLVLSLIVFVCSMVHGYSGAGWVGFVSLSALLTVLLAFIFYLIGLYSRIPGPTSLIVLSVLVFACGSVHRWGSGQGWLQFVSISALASLLLCLLLHVLNVARRVPLPLASVEFIYYCVFTVFFLIAAIVAAVSANWYTSVAFTAFFAFAATAVFGVDTFFQYRTWRSGQPQLAGGTTVTTTTTSREVTAQY